MKSIFYISDNFLFMHIINKYHVHVLLLFLMCYNFLPQISLCLLSLQHDVASSTQVMISLVLLPVNFLSCMKYLRRLAHVAVTIFIIEPVNK